MIERIIIPRAAAGFLIQWNPLFCEIICWALFTERHHNTVVWGLFVFSVKFLYYQQVFWNTISSLKFDFARVWFSFLGIKNWNLGYILLRDNS